MNQHSSLKKLIQRKIAVEIAKTKFKLFTLSRTVPSQTKFIQKSNWNHLVILDACRYDFFEQEIYSYLGGKLLKVFSSASCTDQWLVNVWKGFHNLTYFSANPMVNSRGIMVHGFRAKDHFKEIIDIWDQGWNEELSTVPPWNVNEAISRFKRAKSVIHYMQPHGPWIGKTKLTIRGKGFQDLKKPVMADALIAERIRSKEISIEMLRQAYKDNLRTVLKYVTELIPHLHGRVVLTSDHGELLGEYGLLLHPSRVRAVELRSIPWFEVR